MHEATIVAALMEIVLHQARQHGVTRVTRVNIKVGHLKAVEPQSLRACFDAFAEETVAEGAELVIDHVAARARCQNCGAETVIDRFHFQCGRCGGQDLTLTAGQELYVESFEVG